jgi:hypothetical protein
LTADQVARLYERIMRLKDVLATEWVPERSRKVIDEIFDIVLENPAQ